MSWRESDPGEWRRPAGKIEALFTKYYGLGFSKDYAEYHLSFATKYKVKSQSLDAEALKKAWAALRFDLPSLCVTFDVHCKEIVYKVPDEETLDQWISRTFITNNEPSTPDEEFWTLVHDKEQSIYHFPHRRELIIRGPHWNIDGIGAAMLTNRFYYHLDRVLSGKNQHLPWGHEVSRLQVSIEEALDLPKQETPEITAHAEKQAQELFGNRPSLGLEYEGDVDREPGKPRLATLVFSSQSTTALIAACRALRFTVTSVIHTALILQTYKQASASRKTLHVVDGLPVDHRKYFPAPYNGETFAMAACVSTRPITLPNPADENFASLAPKVAHIYKHGFDMALQTQAFPHMCDRWDPLFDYKPPLGFQLNSNVMLSNSGILEDYIQAERKHVEVEEADLYAEVVSRNSVLNVHTWQGKLHLNLEYNLAYYSDELMGEFLNGLRNSLALGMGLSLEVEPYTFARR